jgi:hypothetical protein
MCRKLTDDEDYSSRISNSTKNCNFILDVSFGDGHFWHVSEDNFFIDRRKINHCKHTHGREIGV